MLIMMTTPVFSAELDTKSADATLACPDDSILNNRESLKAAAVKATGDAYIYKKSNECGREVCRTNDYMMKKSNIIVSSSRGDWSCALLPGNKQRKSIVGLVRNDDIVIYQDNSPLNWTGIWVAHEYAFLKISKNKNNIDLNVDGGSYYGAGDNIKFGSIDGKATPISNSLIVRDRDPNYGCEIIATFVGQYLLVNDNMKCGYMNVRFSGIYEKVGKRYDIKKFRPQAP